MLKCIKVTDSEFLIFYILCGVCCMKIDHPITRMYSTQSSIQKGAFLC